MYCRCEICHLCGMAPNWCLTHHGHTFHSSRTVARPCDSSNCYLIGASRLCILRFSGAFWLQFLLSPFVSCCPFMQSLQIHIWRPEISSLEAIQAVQQVLQLKYHQKAVMGCIQACTMQDWGIPPGPEHLRLVDIHWVLLNLEFGRYPCTGKHAMHDYTLKNVKMQECAASCAGYSGQNTFQICGRLVYMLQYTCVKFGGCRISPSYDLKA